MGEREEAGRLTGARSHRVLRTYERLRFKAKCRRKLLKGLGQDFKMIWFLLRGDHSGCRREGCRWKQL